MEDNVNHPNHYEGTGPVVRIECIDVARYLPFNRGNAFKYVWRCGHKGGMGDWVEDLRKALWYLEDDRLHLGHLNRSAAEAIAAFSLISREAYQRNTFEPMRYAALREIVYGRDPSWTIREMINSLLGVDAGEQEDEHDAGAGGGD